MKKWAIFCLAIGMAQSTWADDFATYYPEQAQQIQYICDLARMVEIDTIVAQHRGTDKATALANIMQHPEVLVLRQKITMMDDETQTKWISNSVDDGYNMGAVIPKHYSYENVEILARHSTGAGHEVCLKGLANKYRAKFPVNP